METVLDQRSPLQFDDFDASRARSLSIGDPSCAALPRRLDPLEIWESESTRPPQIAGVGGSHIDLAGALENYLPRCLAHPYLPRAEIDRQKLQRMKHLVELAYTEIPVYRDKYDAVGFKPSDLRTIDDIELIPVITKQELVAAFPDRCLNPRYRPEDLFHTRSSGSSGQTLLIRVDLDAIVSDTIQGVRQFVMQSGGEYRPSDLIAHVYTVPWWFSSIAGAYPTAFISNVLPAARVAEHLGEMQPEILSCYPSNLEALVEHAELFDQRLRLAVTHSEHSTKTARAQWARRLGAPVLDEYSSEEATRIALEAPCGHYHVCEDSVHLEVLDPVTMCPQTPGKSGVAVITNLLNEAMPFIRYVQGDCITEPASPEPCGMNWKQIESIGGRANDAFINKFGRSAPAGSLLDITYRWMFDCDIHLKQFELVQLGPEQVAATFAPGSGVSEAKIRGSLGHLQELIGLCLEHPVHVDLRLVEAFPPAPGKRRPIRRAIAS
jgi:phenylacetate-CoA ligase